MQNEKYPNVQKILDFLEKHGNIYLSTWYYNNTVLDYNKSKNRNHDNNSTVLTQKNMMESLKDDLRRYFNNGDILNLKRTLTTLKTKFSGFYTKSSYAKDRIDTFNIKITIDDAINECKRK